MDLFCGIILISFGLYVLINFIKKLCMILFLKKHGEKVFARITFIEKIEDDTTSYEATYEYKLKSGYYIKDTIKFSSEYSYRRGQKLEIYIDKNNSKTYVVNSKSALIYTPIGDLIAGLICLVSGLICMGIVHI
jgi:Protein of unknown function (DUF3592)